MKAQAGEAYTVYNQYLKSYTACQVAYIAPPDTVSKEAWAINRQHLAYLIEYLSAVLREKPKDGPKKTQADHLPTFMKSAKNRGKL